MGMMGASGRTLRGRKCQRASQRLARRWASGMCYTRAGDADLLRRGHWLGCFSIEYERGVVAGGGQAGNLDGKLLWEACKATFLLLLQPAYLSSSHPMSVLRLTCLTYLPFASASLVFPLHIISRFLIKADAFACAVDPPLLLLLLLLHH